ncbi:MAG: hypothetical protein ACTTJC_01515 [Campylobacter sp.]
MKIFACLLFCCLLFAIDISNYNAIFNEISKPKNTLDTDEISHIYNPFVKNFIDINYSSQEFNKENEPFILQAIFENRAKISSKWYQKNDSINGYKIIKITQKEVILKENNTELKLQIKKENNNVKIR